MLFLENSQPHVWRTDTVKALCQAMREIGDYSALPILADALEEAGFESEKDGAATLKYLRSPLDHTTAEAFVAQIYSDESAEAVWRIETLAAEMGPPGYPSYLSLDGEDGDMGDCMTYHRLMEAALQFEKTGDDGLGPGSMDWSNMGMDRVPFSGLRVSDQFWKDWSVVTGRTPPEGAEHAIFNCSC